MSFSSLEAIADIPHNEDNAPYGSKKLRLAPRAFAHSICVDLLDGTVNMGVFISEKPKECCHCKGPIKSGFVVQFKRAPNSYDVRKGEKKT